MIMLAPFSRALVVMQPQSTWVEGVNIVMKSSAPSSAEIPIEELE
jgi:hypothetical protein